MLHTFDVLGQGFPGAGVVDAVSAPGGEELEQPGRGRVGDGGLQAAAAQDHQGVFLRVEAGGASNTLRNQPQQEGRLEPGAEHHHPAGEGENRRGAGRGLFLNPSFLADHLLGDPGRH